MGRGWLPSLPSASGSMVAESPPSHRRPSLTPRVPPQPGSMSPVPTGTPTGEASLPSCGVPGGPGVAGTRQPLGRSSLPRRWPGLGLSCWPQDTPSSAPRCHAAQLSGDHPPWFFLPLLPKALPHPAISRGSSGIGVRLPPLPWRLRSARLCCAKIPWVLPGPESSRGGYCNTSPRAWGS